MTAIADDFAAIAWRDFVTWAASNDDMQKAFVAETGRNPWQPVSYIESLVDDATGKLGADMRAFMFWVTERHWGLDYAPQTVRDAIAAEREDTP